MQIILIGMPGSGKTTIGRIASKILKIKHWDTDKLIQKKENNFISEIIKKKGEDYFRKIESQVIKDLLDYPEGIITTGGGVVKNICNINILKQLGTIVWIKREIDEIAKEDHSKRPLIQSKEDLQKLYIERKDLYQKYSEYIILNKGSLQESVKNLIDLYNEIK